MSQRRLPAEIYWRRRLLLLAAFLFGFLIVFDLLVLNDTRVVPARIRLERPRGEVLLLEHEGGGQWRALIDELLANQDLAPETRQELLDFKSDMAEGEFTDMDAKYLRGLHALRDAVERGDPQLRQARLLIQLGKHDQALGFGRAYGGTHFMKQPDGSTIHVTRRNEADALDFVPAQRLTAVPDSAAR